MFTTLKISNGRAGDQIAQLDSCADESAAIRQNLRSRELIQNALIAFLDEGKFQQRVEQCELVEKMLAPLVTVKALTSSGLIGFSPGLKKAAVDLEFACRTSDMKLVERFARHFLIENV